MDKSPPLYKQYKVYSLKLMKFFLKAQINLPAKARRGNLLAIILNYNIWYSFALMSFFLYLVFCHPAPADVKLSQTWSTFFVLQVATRGISCMVCSEEVLQLFDWFLATYETDSNPDYHEIFTKYQTTQNKLIGLIMEYLPTILGVIALIYVFQPIVLRTGELPTPMYWRGIPDQEVERWMFWTYFVVLCYSAFNVYNSVMAIDSFFMISIIFFAFRFQAIRDIMQLLNYEGKRNKQKDQRIIRDCYLMHLDLLDKIDQFQSYFNIYGLFHFFSPILVQAILTYSMSVNGFDMMKLVLILVMINTIAVVCFFGQALTASAGDFCDGIYQMQWEDLDVSEQKMILLILMRTQSTVSIKAGNTYELDFAMWTQVVKFQASFYAFIKTI